MRQMDADDKPSCQNAQHESHRIGDGLIEFIAIGCLDNIVHATDVF